QQTEQGGLARPVRAKNAHELAWPHVEGGSRPDRESTVGGGQVACRHHRAATQFAGFVLGRRGCCRREGLLGHGPEPGAADRAVAIRPVCSWTSSVTNHCWKVASGG